MNLFVHVASAIPVETIDPGVKANNTAPWMTAMRDVAGMVMVSAIVIAVIIVIIGIVLAIAGKLGQMQSAQSAGWMILVWGLVGAAVIGSVSGFIMWGTTISIAPAAPPTPAPAAAGSFLSAAGLLVG